MKTIHNIRDHFEQSIIRHFLVLSIAILVFYISYDVLSAHYERALGIIPVLIVYTALFYIISRLGASVSARRIVVLIFMVGTQSGFISLGGANALNAIDFCILILLIVASLPSRDMYVFIGLLILQFLADGYIQLYQPDLVVNMRMDDPVAFDMTEILLRLGIILHAVFLYKTERDRERDEYDIVHRELRLVNEESERKSEYISCYNQQLKCMVEKLSKEKIEANKANRELEKANKEIVNQGQQIHRFNIQLQSLVADLENEKKNAEKLNMELKVMYREISEKNQIIESTNHLLERKVEERTSSLRDLYKRLIDYAFYNSHKVRGPLARILGLLNLMRMTKIDFQGASKNAEIDYFLRLNESADELDEAVRKITMFLNDAAEAVECDDIAS